MSEKSRRWHARGWLDLTQFVEQTEKKYGKVGAIGRQVAFDAATKRWCAFPDYFIDFLGLYRKDLWDEIGMTPDTWDDVRKGGAKLKAKGYPIGISLAHLVDPNNSYRSMLWSYGADAIE